MPILTSLHDHSLFFSIYTVEETIRRQTLAYLAKEKATESELAMVEQSAKLLVAISQDYTKKNDDDALIVHFGIRLANATFCAVKLMLSGYYQQTFGLSRDITETGFLLHYLVSNPSEMEVWRTASDKDRRARFSPVKIRLGLEKLDGNFSRGREKVYSDASEWGAHVSPRSFNLLRSNNSLRVGPFFEGEYVKLCIRELFSRLCPSAHIISASLKDMPDELRLFAESFTRTFMDIVKNNGVMIDNHE